MYPYEMIFYKLGYWIYGYEDWQLSSELTNNQDFVLSLLSAVICLFVLALPFLIVWWVVKRFL